MMLKIAPLLETTDGMSKLSKLGAAVFRKPALLSNQRFHLCRAETSIVLGPLQQLGVGFKPLQVLFLRSEADPQGHSILLKKGGLKCRGLQLHTCRGHRESTTCQLERILNVSPGVCPRFCQCTDSKHTPQPGFVSLTFPKNVSSGRSLLGRSTIFDTSHQASHNCFYTQTEGHEQKQPRRGVSTTSGALQAAGVIGQLITQESLEVANEGELEEPVQSSVGGIHLIVGPMFAGKTTALLNRMQAELIAGRRVALVKSDKDTRYGLNAVISHDGMQMPCWPVPNLSTFRAKIGEEMYGKLDVIGIDEAQFFKDLYNFCQVAADYEGKTLIVAGLDGDFMRNNFGSALDLIPLADSVVKLSSRCELCGKSAAFTLRKTDDKKTEVIGGADVYMPVCRQHYVNGQNLKREWPSISTASRTRSCSEFDQRCRL